MFIIMFAHTFIESIFDVMFGQNTPKSLNEPNMDHIVYSTFKSKQYELFANMCFTYKSNDCLNRI